MHASKIIKLIFSAIEVILISVELLKSISKYLIEYLHLKYFAILEKKTFTKLRGRRR